MPALDELAAAYSEAKADAAFWAEFESLSRDYSGRPTPLYLAERLTEHCGGARIFLKREDLAHTGAHKINNALGQGLLARRMGKQRIIAETGAGQHGVATAAVCAMLGLECIIYMGEEDMQPPVAQCLPHEADGRRGQAGLQRQPDAEGCHQRGDPGLGDQCPGYPLPPRLGGRAPPLSR